MPENVRSHPVLDENVRQHQTNKNVRQYSILSENGWQHPILSGNFIWFVFGLVKRQVSTYSGVHCITLLLTIRHIIVLCNKLYGCNNGYQLFSFLFISFLHMYLFRHISDWYSYFLRQTQRRIVSKTINITAVQILQSVVPVSYSYGVYSLCWEL